MKDFLIGDNLFNRTMTKVFDLFVIGILTLLYSIPIITAGAAITAAYTVMLKMVKNHEGGIVASFHKEFKDAFKGSIGGWLIVLAVNLLLVFDLLVWTHSNSSTRSLTYGITVALLGFTLAVSDWYFTIRARFVETSASGVRRSIRFAFAFFPYTILMGVYSLAVVLVLTKIGYFIILAVFLGFGLISYPKIFLLRKMTDKYISDNKEKLEFLNGADADEVEDSDDDAEEGTGKKKKHSSYRDENANIAAMKREVGEIEPEEREVDPDDELTGLAAEKAKLSKMNRKEKIEYMMMYYKGYALGALVVIGLIWVLVYQLFLADKRERFQVAVVNGYITESDMDFSDRLIKDLEIDENVMTAYFDTQYRLGYPGMETEMSDASFQEKWVMNITVGSTDAAIVAKSFMDYSGSDLIYRDIHEILTDEQLKKVEGRVIYATTEEGKTYPAGIDISDSKYAASIGLGVSLMNDKDRMLLAFPVNSTHIDQIRKFADFFIE